MPRRKKIIHNVEAIDLGDKGKIIGRTPDGEILLIEEGCVPGDIIDFVYLRKKKGLKSGKVVKITKDSPWRTEPICEHFGVCGGCKWQNLNYQKQLELKENNVRQAIKKIAKDDIEKVEPILACTEIYEYRNKLEYTFSTKRWLTEDEVASGEEFADREGLGFHRAGAFDKVVQINKCHLQDDLSNQIRNYIGELAQEKRYAFYNIKENKGLLRNIVVRNTTLGQWMVTIIFGEKDEESINELLENVSKAFPDVASWNFIINTKMNSSTFDLPVINYSGDSHIEEKLDRVRYNISPKSFFQTNSKQAKRLYDVAQSYAELTGTEVLYDLYTGTGSIALYMADQCKKAIGIEEVKEAIDDARINAKLNDKDNTIFLVGDVKEVLKPSFRESYGAPDIVITDPPRAGMHEDVITTILALSPPKLVYISCNPSTQARDILMLKEKYELVKVRPVDMFPHTSHIELVALLKLK